MLAVQLGADLLNLSPLWLRGAEQLLPRRGMPYALPATSERSLFLRYRRIGLPDMLRARRIDVGPRACTSGPDVSGNLHVAWVVERSDPQHSGLGARGTLAVDGRPAVTAEVAVERATAISSDDVALRRALRNVQGCSGDHRINAAARTGGLLAVPAVASAKFRDRNAHGVAYCAA